MLKNKLISLFLINAAILATGCVSQRGDSPKRQSLFGSLFFSPEKNDAQPAQQDHADFGSIPVPPVHSQHLAGQNSQQQDFGIPSQNQRSPGYLPPAVSRELTKVEGNVWRCSSDAGQIFSMMTRLLSQNYLLNQVDRKNLNLNTDWDKFFIDGRLFRNRLSVSVFPVGSRQTEIVVKNSVEYFAGNPNKPEEMSAANWLPSPDLTDEVARVIDSMNRQIAFYRTQPLR